MRIAGLRVGGRVDRYVGGLFVASYATSFMLVVGLVLIMDLASNLDFFEPWPDGRSAPATAILRYYALQIPFLYLQVAPFVTVVAGLFTVAKLVKNNETVAAMSAGVSVHRVLASVFLGGLLAAVFMFGLRETATSAFGFKRDTLQDLLDNQRDERVFEDLWFSDDFGNDVRLDEFRPATGDPEVAEVIGLRAYFRELGVDRTLRADRAVWSQVGGRKTWVLEGGVVADAENSESAHPVETMTGVQFSPQAVLLSVKGQERAMELSFSEIDQLARRDPENTEYLTLLQYHLTFPLANVVLLLVALPFLIGRERGRNVEGLVAGCLLCVIYFSVDFVTRSLGTEGALSPLMASWLPVILFGSLGAVLYDSMRT